MTVTNKVDNNNYSKEENKKQYLLAGGNHFINVSLHSVAGETFKKGTVLGYNATNDRYEVTDSTGLNIASAIFHSEFDLTLAAGETKIVSVCVQGDVYEDFLVFQGSDTLATVAASTTTYKDELSNKNIFMRKYEEISVLEA